MVYIAKFMLCSSIAENAISFKIYLALTKKDFMNIRIFWQKQAFEILDAWFTVL